MSTRYIEDPECIRMECGFVSNEELGQFYPGCYEFFPTDEVVLKLIQRMTQIKKIPDIWKGFKVVKQKDDTETWHPIDLLYFFKEDEINNLKVVFN